MSAQPALSNTVCSASSSCHLVALDGRVLPLQSVDIDVEARGGLASVVVRQTFRNVHAEPLTANYQLPLPADGAVTGFAFTLGERRVVGEIDRRQAARERFERAVLEGRTAALLEQDRSNLFAQQIGNIPPGTSVVAEVRVEQPLLWQDEGWEWRFPTTVAPRYLGNETPEPESVHVAIADGKLAIGSSVSLRILDDLTGPASSPSHTIDTTDSKLAIAGALDRDVVVRWSVATHEPAASLESANGPEGLCGLLTLVPPTVEASLAPVPRDLILLIDTSGSMDGRPLEQARIFAQALVSRLRPEDRLEMIEFSSRPHRWKSRPEVMTRSAISKAISWLGRLEAGGCTEMHEAILEALRPLRPDAHRQVVLVSDGLIGFEREIIGEIKNRLPHSSRVHTIGVGSSVNRALLYPAARAGGGLDCVVSLDEDPTPQVERLLRRTGEPIVVDLELSGSALVGHAPARLPDLFAASAARVSARLRPGELIVRGRTAEGPWQHRIRVAEGAGRPVVCTRYARERVEDLEVAAASGDPSDMEIEWLGLEYRISTRMTSWVAATSEQTVDPTEPGRREDVPHALAYGMSAQGVGLRASNPPPSTDFWADASDDCLDAEMMSVDAPRSSRGRRSGRAGAQARRLKGRSLEMEPPSPEPEGDEASSGILDRLVKGIFGEPQEALRIRVRVRLHEGNDLVVEFTSPSQITWDPSLHELHWSDGRSAPGTVGPATTRAGDIGKGLVVRLVLRVPHADLPAQITLGDLILEL